MARRLATLATVLALVWTTVAPLGAAAADPPRPERTLPASVSEQRLDRPVRRSDPALTKLHASLRGARGPQRVAVRLAAPPAGAVADQGETAQANQKAAVRRQQDGLIASARKLDRGARVLGRTAVATNIVGLRIDAAVLDDLARDPNVVSIKPIKDYELALSETVPYIGASAVQAAGYTGQGVRVAVLDTGIDYTHAALGGPGPSPPTRPPTARAPATPGTRPSTASSRRRRSSVATTSSARAGRAATASRIPTPTRSTSTATAPTSPTSSVGRRGSPPT